MARTATSRPDNRTRKLSVFWPVVTLTLFQGCAASSPTASPETADPVVLTIGYPHATGQDPLHGMQQGARLISHEGLVLANRNGRIQARLAESWYEEPDGLAWHFKLRKQTFFHDGSTVDSAAVKESLQRSLANADIESFPGLADIIAVEAPSPREVVLRLKQRSAFLLDDLGVPIQKIQTNGVSVGTGPYITTSASQNELLMSAFSQYYRGAPKIAQVRWRSYSTVRTAWAAMMRGEVDVLYEVGPEALEFMRGESVEIYPFLRSYLFGIILNVDRKIFSDARIREALNYAIDRPELVSQALKRRGIPAGGLAWPQHWAYDTTVPSFSYDPQRASALLNASATPPLSDAEHARQPSRIRFSCLVPEGFALWERFALMAQRDLSEIGVDMQLESLPFVAFNQRIAARDFDAVMMEFVIGSSPSRPFTFWYSSSKRNAWGYRSPGMDDALEGIRRASNDGAYRDAFRRFQLEGLTNPPAIVLALGENARAVSRRFQVTAPAGSDILPTIADWLPVSTARTAN